MKGHLDAEHLKGYSYKELQALAKQMGLAASGKAGDIMARIVAAEADATEERRDATEGKDASLATVKVVVRFLDRQLNQTKDAGETYQVGRERAKELRAAGVAEIVG